MDLIISCSKMHEYLIASAMCGGISDVVALPVATAQDPDPDISDFQTVFIQPVYLDQNSSKLVGFTGGSVDWLAAVMRSFGSYHENIECVITNGNVSFTYAVNDFPPSYLKGVGDLHDVRYESYRKQISIVAFPDTQDPVVYTISVYPTSTYFAEHTTNTPAYVCMGGVLMIAICSAMFLSYDLLMRRESSRKSAVLDTKRRFVRFISHEIRTPLNAVNMGLALIVQELKSLLAAVQGAASGAAGVISNTAQAAVLVSVITSLSGWLELSHEMKGNSESAVDVLNDLLNYDKIEMGTLRLEFSAVNITHVVQKCTAAFQMQARQKRVLMQLSGDLCDGAAAGEGEPETTVDEHAQLQELVVAGDRGRIAEVLRNLISNALKFTPTGGTVAVHGKLLPLILK